LPSFFFCAHFAKRKSGIKRFALRNGYRQLDKSFDQTFSKVCEVEGAQPSSLSAESETSLIGAFLFAKLFLLRPFRQKEKRNQKIRAT